MEGIVLDKIEIFATDFITNKIPDTVIYHNLNYTHRLVKAVLEIGGKENLSEKELELLQIAAWIWVMGYSDISSFIDGKQDGEHESAFVNCIIKESKPFLENIHYPKEDIEEVYRVLINAQHPLDAKNQLDIVFSDALYMDYTWDKGKKRMKKMYQELLVFNAENIGKKKWFVNLVAQLEKHTFFTDYGKLVLEPKKHALIKSIKKEVKAIENIQNVALKNELHISDKELKKLKKSIGESSKIDIRAIQTLFRNTSRNHYTLSTMVDRKANIMISINAIINSLIIGGIFGSEVKMPDPKLIPVFILMVASLVSISYAIMSIRPDKTHGEFTEDDIRNKKGNLLYFGNFYNMSFRDYEWAMLEMLTDKDYLYSSLIRDIYYLGEKLHRKHTYIRKSLTVFLIGTALSGASFLIIKLIFNAF